MPEHILVVDDEPTMRQLLSVALGEEGFVVTTAVNGREALVAILADPPLLVLLDLQMPLMNGAELLDALHSAQVSVPVVLLSAGGQVQAEAVRHHAAGYLAKPFDLDALLALVLDQLATAAADARPQT
jgi:DNA-binding NtrC family response regulator